MEEIPERIRKIIEGHGWLRHLAVGDIMERGVVTIAEDATLKDLDSLIAAKQHTGYPVVDSEGRVTGVITQKDLLRVDKDEWERTPVRTRMSTCLIYVSPDDCVIDAVEKMTHACVGRLLVMEGDRLVGIVTRSCIMDKVIKKMLV